jgi:mRNA-degrading endonuclease RelE of RelBE toxin-antitoxin system
VPSSSWRLVIDPRAEKDLKGLRRQHHPILPSVVRAIDALATQPLSGKPLKGDKRGAQSLRIGDFRII